MNIETELPAAEQHLFTEEEVHPFEYASAGQRFLNWLIDNLLMRFGLSWATGFVIGFVLARLFPEFLVNMVNNRGVEFYLAIYLILILNYLLYYTFCEKIFRGCTLGKLITGTRAVRDDGQELTFADAFLRSLCRLIPFEAFSAFGGHPWHDTITKTMVIKSR
jgi:uncharacterized RDD family membrane protein YckC